MQNIINVSAVELLRLSFFLPVDSSTIVVDVMSTIHHRIHTTVDVGKPPSPPDASRYKSIQVHYHGFRHLPWRIGRETKSPRFLLNGHEWELAICPAGDIYDPSFLTVTIRLKSKGGVKAVFGMRFLNKFGDTAYRVKSQAVEWSSDGFSEWSWTKVIKRSNVFEKDLLDDDGTLAIVLSVKEDKAAAFVPENPLIKMMKKMFNDETTADVCFDVCSAEREEEEGGDGVKRAKASTPFYAHRSILQGCAPMLATLFDVDDNDRMVTAQISDVKPDIFRHLLAYVYGVSVPKEELKAHAKDFINAADKYSIINLKLEAEAVYLNSTKFTVNNAMDNLLYADAMNLALLKETVLDFMAENSTEAIKKISFSELPGSVVKDLVLAFDWSKKRIIKKYCSDSEDDGDSDFEGEDYSLMRVCELRRKLDEKGLGVDGSREAMIETLNNSTGSVSYVNDATVED